MKSFSIFFCLVLALLACAALPGCGTSPTETNPLPPDTGGLFLSKISVAVVPGMTETVEITEEDGSSSGSYSASIDSPDVATATVTGSVLTVTGSDYGTANVTVRNSEGASRTIPVQVYNPKVIDTGELILAFVDQFTLRAHYSGSSGTLYFWQPVVSDGFKALGALGRGVSSNPSGTTAMMVVKAREGSDAIAPPVNYVKIYQGGYGTCWRPVPPTGYVALGMAISSSFSLPPSLNDVVCVRKDLTMKAEAGSLICKSATSSSGNSFMAWEIVPPDAGDLEDALLPTGTFVALGDIYGRLTGADKPLTHAVMNVLKVRLPLLSEAPAQAYQPKLESADEPSLTTVPVFARAMLVPCNIVRDPRYPGDPNLRVRNSPTYRLEREVFYKKLYFYDNRGGSQVQTNSVTITSGITTTESDRYWSETGVSVTVEAGVNLKVFGAKVSATVSKAFGYEQQRSIAVLAEKSVSTSVNISPGKVAVLWQKFNRFILKRHNGTDLETVDVSEFGIDSYVIDEYPD